MRDFNPILVGLFERESKLFSGPLGLEARASNYFLRPPPAFLSISV